jgi:hypothetical protein
MTAHQVPTIVAHAGMVSEGNQKEIDAAGLSFLLGVPRWRPGARQRLLACALNRSYG